jgi:hypothetical protein
MPRGKAMSTHDRAHVCYFVVELNRPAEDIFQSIFCGDDSKISLRYLMDLCARLRSDPDYAEVYIAKSSDEERAPPETGRYGAGGDGAAFAGTL